MTTSSNGIGTAPVLQFAGVFQSPPLELIQWTGPLKSTVKGRSAVDVAVPPSVLDTVTVMTSVPGVGGLPDNVKPELNWSAGIVMTSLGLPVPT